AAELATPAGAPVAQPAQGAGTGGPPPVARAAVAAAARAPRRAARRGRPAGRLAGGQQPARGARSATQPRRPDPARRLSADRAPDLGTAAPSPSPVPGRGVPSGIHPEPELLPPPRIRRRGARPPAGQGQPATLALAGRGAGAGRCGRGAFPADLGGRAPAGRSLVAGAV